MRVIHGIATVCVPLDPAPSLQDQGVLAKEARTHRQMLHGHFFLYSAAATEKEMGGAFLQTTAASVVKQLAINSPKLTEAGRQNVLPFLSGSSEDSLASGEITGILKSMLENMILPTPPPLRGQQLLTMRV